LSAAIALRRIAFDEESFVFGYRAVGYPYAVRLTLIDHRGYALGKEHACIELISDGTCAREKIPRDFISLRRSRFSIIVEARNEDRESPQSETSVDATYAQRTLAVGAVALATSELAQTKAKNDWVKRFASYEVAEQTTIAEVLKSLGMKAEKSDQPAEMVDKLKNSSNFDADYLAAQLDGHQKLLKIQDEFIQVGKDPAHVGLAKLARGQIKEHIDLLETIQKSLKA